MKSFSSFAIGNLLLWNDLPASGHLDSISLSGFSWLSRLGLTSPVLTFRSPVMGPASGVLVSMTGL